MPSSRKVAVVGATGTIGFALTRSLVELGHGVRAISRGRTAANSGRLDELAAWGAELRFEPDLTDVGALARAFGGYEILVSAMRASPRTIAGAEAAVLDAARHAGVARFVPSEFGTHTLAVDSGVSGLFDAKKRFQEELFASGLAWTIVYGGGIAEYFLPNLRSGDRIEVFSDRALRWPTHVLDDIGAVSALAATDDRTLGHAVQLYQHLVSTEQLLDTLRSEWPHHPFEIAHVTSEQLERMLSEASTDPGERRLSEREILGITYANFVLGKLGDVDDALTLDAGDLYDYVCRNPLELLADRAFVFGDRV